MNKLLTLAELFDNIILRIPDYQRGYSWEKEQLEDLWNDLSNINIANKNSFHFTGIITLNKPTENNNIKLQEEGFSIENNKINLFEKRYKVFNIVDGQQRLVTLLILISCLISSLEKILEEEKEELLSKFISVKYKDRVYYIFGYEKDTPSHQYLIGKIFEDETMEVTEPETVYTKNLERTKHFFLTKLNELDITKRQNLLKKIINRLLFNVFEIEHDKLDMSLVFETLNYRGKALSLLELFKNRLIFLVTKRFINEQQKQLREKIISTWLDIYEWLGKNDKNKLNDDEFLRAFWILYFNHDNDKEKDFNRFEEDLFNNKYSIAGIRNNELLGIRPLEGLLNSFSKAIKYWFFINNPYFENDCELLKEYSNQPQTKELLLRINNMQVGSYMKTLCMAIFFKNYEEINVTNPLLMLIERHNFSTYLLFGKQADANRVQIQRLINQFFRVNNNIKENALRNKIIDYTNKHIEFDNLNKYIHNNHQGNLKFYDWKGIKYVLWHYEAFLQKKSVNEIEDYSKFHIDLIFPDSKGFGIQFPNVTRNRYGDNLNTLKYSLGNITITKRTNPPKSFVELKPLLQNGSYTDQEIAKYDDWTDETILERGLKILDFIGEHWQIYIGDDQQKKQLLVEKLKIDFRNNYNL